MVLVVVLVHAVAAREVKVLEVVADVLADDPDMGLIRVVVDGICLALADDDAVENLGGAADAELRKLCSRTLYQGLVGGGPEPVAFEAEVLQAQACLALIRDHVWAPVLEVLDASDLHARIMDIDPVVGEDVGAIDHHRDADEVPIAKTVGGFAHAFRRGRLEARDELADRHARDEVGAFVLLELA